MADQAPPAPTTISSPQTTEEALDNANGPAAATDERSRTVPAESNRYFDLGTHHALVTLANSASDLTHLETDQESEPPRKRRGTPDE